MKRNILTMAICLCAGLLAVQHAGAAPNAGFGALGFIQDADLNPSPRAGVSPEFRGGTIVINGKRMIVPDNTIVQFPASAWRWADLFDYAAWGPVYDQAIVSPPVNPPAPPAGTTGLALNNPLANRFPSHEVSVTGNIVTTFTPGSQVGAQTYVIGLITPVAQQGLNNHAGYINFIDYANGRFRVGGVIGDPNCVQGQMGGGPTCSGSLVEINDPVGRYGLIHSPDQRFSADTGNPTITTATGYPVCIPRTFPAVDIDCPSTNRPPNPSVTVNPNQPNDPFIAVGAPLKKFTMPAVPNVVPGGPDPRRMAPLMIGDWVDVAGTLFKIDPAGANNPINQYLSAHSLTAHLSIKTAAGTLPAYVRIEEFIFGVGDRNGGPTVAGIAQETSTRVALVAFTTDANPNVTGNLYGVYYPAAGGIQEISFPNGNGTNIVVDDPVRGRIRWTTSNNGSTAGVLANAAGPRKFYREYTLRLSSGTFQCPALTSGLPGLLAGQYTAPIFEYIFGEGTTFGDPVPPYNFNDLGFLFSGEGPDGPGGGAGPLKPFPAFQ